MSIVDVAYGLTAPVEAVMFFMIFDAFFEKRKSFAIWQYVVGISALAVLLKIVNDYLLFRLGNAAGMICAAIFVGLFFYRTSLLKWSFISFFVWFLFVSTEMFVLSMISHVFNLTISEAINISDYLVLGIIVSKAMAIAICYGICVKFKSKKFEVGGTYWLLFIALFSSAIIASFMIYRMLNKLNDPAYNIAAMLSAIGLYVSMFLALYLYERSVKQTQIIHRQEQAEQHMQHQLKHLDEIILKQNELRRIRHDINGHFTALQGYLDAGDIQGGKRYLADLTDTFQAAAPSIHTGNNALDAILNAKQSLAMSKNITLSTKIRIQQALPIAPRDLCIIFSNALDNAIEACDRLPPQAEKSIDLLLMEETETLYCKITNTAPIQNSPDFTTSKIDPINHGFGLSNIREALDNYDATLNIAQNGSLFTLEFLLFL